MTSSDSFQFVLLLRTIYLIIVFGNGEIYFGNDSFYYTSTSKVVLQCKTGDIPGFVNQVQEILRNENASSMINYSGNNSENCISFENLPCSMASLIESMHGRHFGLNYRLPMDNEICTGSYRRNHRWNQYGHMVQFLLDVIAFRHWVSVVLFVDGEDEFPSTAFLQILASRNIQCLIWKLNPSAMTDPANVVPSAVSQYYRLVIISSRYHTILEVAQNRSLFLHPYKWIIMSNSTLEVLNTLNSISLQFIKDLTIVSPIKNTESIIGGCKLILVCNITETQRNEKHFNYLESLSSKEYRVDFYAMLCRDRGLDLLSSGSWKRNRTSIKDRMDMIWPINRDISIHNFKGCIFRVAVAHNPPYVILNRRTDGNFSLSGYDYDVFLELANIMKFEYEFYVVEDGQSGRLTRNEARWTGLVGELVAGKAHLALPSLVLTEERYKVVGFSARISTARTKILIRHLSSTIGVDSYVAPFDIPVWTLFAFNVLLFTIAHVVVNRHSPLRVDYIDSAVIDVQESPSMWRRRRRRSISSITAHDGPLALQVHRLWDSLFSFISSGLQQVPGDSPACWSGRVVIVTFFLFVVIMHTSYSSTLVSYMYASRPQMPLTRLADLATTDDYIPCILRGSSHEELLRAHHGDVLSRILDGDGRGLVISNEEGVERVLDVDSSTRCAFIGDSINIEYIIGNNCSFTYVGNDFIRVHYHLAFQKSFPHQKAFSTYLVKLRQCGQLTRLLRKHLKPMESACEGRGYPFKTTLGFTHVISMFVELVVGMSLAVVIFVIEHFLYFCRFKTNTVLIYPTSDTID